MSPSLGVLFGIASLAAASPGVAAPLLAGTWVEIGPRTTFHFKPCGKAICGVLEDSIYIKADANARDVKNPNPDLRSRPLKGLTVLQQLVPDRQGWTGEVYIPSMGKAFPMTLAPVDASTLHFTLCLRPSDCHTVTLVRARRTR